MKRFIGTISKRTTSRVADQTRGPSSDHPANTPEETALRELVAFCDSKGLNNAGDEYLHLPALVEAVESTPDAAKVVASRIHKYLSKPATPNSQAQYNAIMVLRILAENPGPSFTRYFDSKFVASVKLLLRDGRDMGVQHILRECLELLSVEKASDQNLKELIAMWRKEKQKFEKEFGTATNVQQQHPYPGARQDYFSRGHKLRGLPSPEELAGRVAEANTSAKLLHQMLQSTPAAEFYQNDMLKEFATRCQSASRSIQGYIDATNPSPDEDTMLTLIETNDRLSVAMSKYQRASLCARKSMSKSQQRQHQSEQSQQLQQPQHAQPQAQGSSGQQVESVPVAVSSKNKYIPRLSFPRKTPKASQNPAGDVPDTNPTPASSATTHSGGRVSPIATSLPALPLRPATGSNGVTSTTAPITTQSTTTTTPSIASPTSLPTISADAASTGWQYNPSDFQVENPFADKYSTNDATSNHSNRNSNTIANDNNSHNQFTTTTNNTTTPAPLTSSTYYPGTEYNSFDNHLPQPHQTDNLPEQQQQKQKPLHQEN